MLRKKQEEAKELLVRAVVNNNYLLMLNHPIYEEKISFQMLFFQFLILYWFFTFNKSPLLVLFIIQIIP